jgi:sporulation protein YlmC with PRC-barrel domain
MFNPIKQSMLVSAIALSFAVPALAADPVTQSGKPDAQLAQATQEGADARKLIGRNIKNAQDETVGEIKSVHISGDGKVDQVIVGVGGFLGMGDREVAIAWSDLTVLDNGEKVVINKSKDELKAMAPYSYTDPSYRGRVFSDRGVVGDRPMTTERAPSGTGPTDRAPSTGINPNEGRTAPGTTAQDRATRPADRAPSTATGPAPKSDPVAKDSSAFNTAGDMSGEAIIGATVRNAQNETVGSINDIYVDNVGAVKTIIVSVGGFLGMGSHDVALPWSEVKFVRDGSALIVTIPATKDQLKAMPAFKRLQAQAPRDAAPPATTPRDTAPTTPRQ